PCDRQSDDRDDPADAEHQAGIDHTRDPARCVVGGVELKGQEQLNGGQLGRPDREPRESEEGGPPRADLGRDTPAHARASALPVTAPARASATSERYQSNEALGVRLPEATSTCTSPKRCVNPSAHSKLSSSDHTVYSRTSTPDAIAEPTAPMCPAR